MNINTLDLNLLKAFHALYEERHVSRAGARIGLAQPSMSNALSRLRAQFDDPLFQRSPQGMIPTARAETLAPRIQQTLSLVEEMLTPASFDPKLVDTRIRIATADLTMLTLAPQLMRTLEQTAPKLRVSFQPLDKTRSLDVLEAEDLDLIVGHFGQLPARFHRRALFQDQFQCIARHDHPRIGSELDLETFVNARHALMTLSHDFEGAVDRILKRRKLQRKVVMTCAQFTALPHVIAASDMIATVPATLADFARKAGCNVWPLPFESPEWETEMIWTRKWQASPLGQFVVKSVEQGAALTPRP